jgi:hypothetical protein
MIPGVKYIPYAFISSLSVSFMGSRRSYNIDSPSGGRIQTIIPDAYMITIELKGLIAESQNFLYHMLNENQGKVTVSESSQGIIGNFLDSFRRELNNEGLNNVAQKTNRTTQNQR